MLWYLKDKNYQLGILLSIVWHIFWLFVIRVDERADLSSLKHRPQIYFLGPSLSDDAFNMILESRPELSETYYRGHASVRDLLSPPQEVLERPDPGDLISVPSGRLVWTSAQGSVSVPPPIEASQFADKLKSEWLQSPVDFVEGLRSREVVYFPELPIFTQSKIGADEESLKDAIFVVEVDSNGQVRDVQIKSSSGHDAVDVAWKAFLQRVEFAPSKEGLNGQIEKGEIALGINDGVRL